MGLNQKILRPKTDPSDNFEKAKDFREVDTRTLSGIENIIVAEEFRCVPELSPWTNFLKVDFRFFLKAGLYSFEQAAFPARGLRALKIFKNTL